MKKKLFMISTILMIVFLAGNCAGEITVSPCQKQVRCNDKECYPETRVSITSDSDIFAKLDGRQNNEKAKKLREDFHIGEEYDTPIIPGKNEFWMSYIIPRPGVWQFQLFAEEVGIGKSSTRIEEYRVNATDRLQFDSPEVCRINSPTGPKVRITFDVKMLFGAKISDSVSVRIREAEYTAKRVGLKLHPAKAFYQFLLAEDDYRHLYMGWRGMVNIKSSSRVGSGIVYFPEKTRLCFTE